MAKKILCGGGLMERHRLLQRPFNEWSRQWLIPTTGANTMAEIIPMTEEQKFQLEIYKLVMNQNAAAEEAFQFIGTDELKLELFKIHFQSGGANSDITTRTIEAVRKSKEALDLFTTGA
ncbi:DUF2560 family protein [Salmonella phage SF6]|nr:DUF2560 family protein [Salmonella phage SF6]QEI23885.1 hypothetical protein [Salmonella phage Si3 KFo-2019]